MPSEVFEEPLELEVELLEATSPSKASYPYPSLRLTGTRVQRTFRSVILENPYLRAVVVPTLGGRLLSLFDKRTGTELLKSPAVVPGGDRGAEMIGGIELTLTGAPRLTAMGAAQFAAHEADEDDPAEVWVAEAVTGSGLSWHLKVSLPADRAELELEARVFNRGFVEVAYNGGLMTPSFAECSMTASHLLIQHEGSGLAISLGHGLSAPFETPDRVGVTRFASPRVLAPRQMDAWSTSIRPFSGLENVDAVGVAGALHVNGSRLRLQVAVLVNKHKLVVLTKSGATMEAPFQAHPEHIAEFTLPEPVMSLALLDEHRNIVLSWDGPPRNLPTRRAISLEARKPDLDSEEARFDVGTRHAAKVWQALTFLRSGDTAAADAALEQALVYNGEDHLAWWLKAVCKRLGGETEESPELLNAHYLAPLEPALRAESFLAQPRTVEKAASPLLASMAEHPENFVEVAALLVEAGMFEQAGYWIDEALRHADLPMLRYLLAYCHLEASGLEYEAASQVEAAGAKAGSPPYPWRPIEMKALRRLGQRFPADAAIAALIVLAEPGEG